ncbi:4-alpha-glucanotransferase [Desulfovibrio inopinatus]|uniref:4-alpha-glucanotransferase n=1 Tax=Desulfovibrio inopinatus TaxID=102109 RepID=UPI000425A0B7|nr:4-alpha-glucanotransferase [Desulfovibrio inopinatus]
MHRRGSGILLHISSLPSRYGIGDLGPEAYRFADFLADAGQSYWQILPLNPTSSYIGNSPYSSDSAFAGNPLFISPELMVENGDVDPLDVPELASTRPDRVDYQAVEGHRTHLLKTAYAKVETSLENDCCYGQFQKLNAYWLDDHALFRALKAEHGGVQWTKWPEPLRYRDPSALAEATDRLASIIRYEKYVQYLFHRQWFALKLYLQDKNILTMGDIPIYVTHDSADVWAHQELFQLDSEGEPTVVAGVPPDYFSKTGQRWGNPVYAWDVHRLSHFHWWIKRIEHNLDLTDFIRLDHFRGFAAYWEVPVEEETAINGEWVDGPGHDFFNALLKHFARLPIIAEDLGIITADVEELKSAFDLPGMRILQFAFGDNLADSRDIPHNYDVGSVAYSGTHDNNTTKGWFSSEASEEVKESLFAYIGHEVSEDEVSTALIRLAMASVAEMAIFPLQDVLGLGAGARMNTPSLPAGNWTWRLKPGLLSDEIARRMQRWTTMYGR